MNDRKHLTAREVERLITATRGSRTELRDRCLILLMFRHGQRVSEACALKLHQVDLESRVLHVARLKKGLSTTHPLRGDELRAVKACSCKTLDCWIWMRLSGPFSLPTKTKAALPESAQCVDKYMIL